MKTKIKGIITVFLVFMILMLLMSMKLVFASDERVIKLGVSDISDRGQSAVFLDIISRQVWVNQSLHTALRGLTG